MKQSTAIRKLESAMDRVLDVQADYDNLSDRSFYLINTIVDSLNQLTIEIELSN